MPKGTKVEEVYQALRREGKSEESAARIAQAQTGESLATGKPAKGKENAFKPIKVTGKSGKTYWVVQAWEGDDKKTCYAVEFPSGGLASSHHKTVTEAVAVAKNFADRPDPYTNAFPDENAFQIKVRLGQNPHDPFNKLLKSIFQNGIPKEVDFTYKGRKIKGEVIGSDTSDPRGLHLHVVDILNPDEDFFLYYDKVGNLQDVWNSGLKNSFQPDPYTNAFQNGRARAEAELAPKLEKLGNSIFAVRGTYDGSYGDGWEAAKAGKPRTPPSLFKTLGVPQGIPVDQKEWLKGYDEALRLTRLQNATPIGGYSSEAEAEKAGFKTGKDWKEKYRPGGRARAEAFLNERLARVGNTAGFVIRYRDKDTKEKFLAQVTARSLLTWDEKPKQAALKFLAAKYPWAEFISIASAEV